MAPEIIQKIELAGGENNCHRKPPLLFPGPLGTLKLIHQPCLREKCTLWDPLDKRCLDLTNAHTLIRIARTLQVILDHLPPELP